MSKKPAAAAPVRKIRCAIYTRKSTDEGLDKQFNTLDAQRDACAAYIASQRHEGWVEVADYTTITTTTAATRAARLSAQR